MTFRFLPVIMAGLISSPLVAISHAEPSHRPNVILIMTDDQGYGEIAAHGNPLIKTPHLDQLHSTSVRLTDFHVDPTCSPTRSALLTGRYSTRTGVWHTINGRSMMRPDELTLAEVFKANGTPACGAGKALPGTAATACRVFGIGPRAASKKGVMYPCSQRTLTCSRHSWIC